MRIEEQTLRTLVASGSVRQLVAQRVRREDRWAWLLQVHVGIVEAPLETKRGGPREFRTLDALAGLVDSLGLGELTVKLNI
jgi:hypothetical protein